MARSTLKPGLSSGLLAGFAGATAMNAMTYAHKAVYGSSDEANASAAAAGIARAVGARIPGSASERQTRLEGLGPLFGLAVAGGVGAVAGALRAKTVKVPFVVASVTIGLTAMVISDTVMTKVGVADPHSWTAWSVMQDVLPHLAFGGVTVISLHRMLDPHTVQVA